MSLKQLVFDTTDAASIADSDSVGAYIRSSDGSLIDSVEINSVERLAVDSTLKDGAGTALTSTLIGGKQSLDVNVVEGINVEVDLDAADDSVAAYLNDGAGNAISSTGGALHISDAGGSLTVDATDLDIRNLVFATDKVDVSGSSVSITGDVNVTQGTSPWVVSATDLDIRDLDAAQDSVQSNLFDGAGTALTSTLEGGKQALDVYLTNDIEVNDAALAVTALANAVKVQAVANTAEVAVASNLANRKYLYLSNQDNKKIFVGASGVSAANGFPIPPQGVIELRLGAAVDLYFVGSASATPEIRTLELA